MTLFRTAQVCMYMHIYIIYPVVVATVKTITILYKLNEGSSRLDRDIAEFKKPLSVTGALKSCYIYHARIWKVRR